MPNYSSNKTAWPTKNLFVGGAPSRPFQMIGVATRTKTTVTQGAPTIKAAKAFKAGFDLCESKEPADADKSAPEPTDGE